MLSQRVNERDLEAQWDEIHHNLDVTDFMLGIRSPAESRLVRRIRPSYSHYLLYFIPLIYAMTEASQVAFGMKNSDRELAYLSIAATAIVSFASNSTTIVDGFKEFYQALSMRKLPEELPDISPTKKTICSMLAIALTCYVAYSDSTQNYYYSNAVPKEHPDAHINPDAWMIAAVLMVTATALNAFFSESMKNYRFFHESMAGRKIEYANSFSRKVSPVLGYTLAGISGINDMLLSFVGRANAQKITKPCTELYILNGTSSINGLSEFALQQYYLIQTIDKIIGTLTNRYPTTRETIGTIMSLSLPAFLAISLQSLSLELVVTSAKFYKIELSAGLIKAAEAFSIVSAVTYTLIGGMYLYPLLVRDIRTLRERDHDELAIKGLGETGPLLEHSWLPSEPAPLRSRNDIPLLETHGFFSGKRPPRRLGYRIEDELLRFNSRPR